MRELMAFEDTWTTRSGEIIQISKLVSHWLAERSAHTKDAYLRDMHLFVQHIGTVQFDRVTREQLSDFALSLKGSPSTRKRAISCIKSFYSYLFSCGYVSSNIGAAMRPPKVQRNLHERILDEYLVLKMIDLEPDTRNHCLLRLLYSGGLRVSELCDLTWKDAEETARGGQVHVLGKGSKERTVPISKGTWDELMVLKGAAAGSDAYIFQSRTRKWKGAARSGKLHRTTVIDIVRNAAERAGIGGWEHVSPHWLRHCHATHALDNGAKLTVIKETLGHSSIEITDAYQHLRPSESSAYHLKV